MTEVQITHDDHTDAGTLEVFPPKQPPSLPAQQMLRAHAQMMSDAWDLADKMCATTMVPTRFYRKPEDGTAAILYGSELGLNPIQSLQRIIAIHGMPTIEGRTMQALLQSRGYKFRWIEKSDERCELIGWDPKDPDSVDNPERSVWELERATRAEYVPTKDAQGNWKTNSNGKLLGNMKYITDPQAMLKAKCQAEVCRDLDAAALLGIAYSTEELESENFDNRVTAERVTPAASAPITADEILGEDPEPPAKAKRKPRAKAEPDQEPVDAEEVANPEPAAEDATAPEAEPAPPQQPDPIEPDPEGGPAGDQTNDERGKLIRRLFALLGKGDVTDREDRLVIYRRALKRPEVSSTNDLSDDDLRFVISGLDAQDRKGDLAMWLEGYLIAAVEEETAAAQAAAATTTEGN